MKKYDFLDPKYDGLSPNEKLRQVDRDNLLYEQTEALKSLNTKNDNYYVATGNPSNLFIIWFCTFVFGGIALAIIYLTEHDYKLGLGNIPLYIYLGLLVGIPILGLINKFIKSINNANRNAHIAEIKDDVEKQIRTLQRKWDTLESKSKIEKEKIRHLEFELGNPHFRDSDEKDIEKQLDDLREKVYEYEDKQIEIEEKIEKLEDMIY